MADESGEEADEGDGSIVNGDDTTTSTQTRAWWLSSLVVGWVVATYTIIYARLVWNNSPALVKEHHLTMFAITVLVVLYVVGPTAIEGFNKIVRGK